MSGVLPALELVLIGGPGHGQTVRTTMGTDVRMPPAAVAFDPYELESDEYDLYRPLHANAHAKDSFRLRIEALAHESLSTEEARRMAVEWFLEQLVGKKQEAAS